MAPSLRVTRGSQRQLLESCFLPEGAAREPGSGALLLPREGTRGPQCTLEGGKVSGAQAAVISASPASAGQCPSGRAGSSGPPGRFSFVMGWEARGPPWNKSGHGFSLWGWQWAARPPLQWPRGLQQVHGCKPLAAFAVRGKDREV